MSSAYKVNGGVLGCPKIYPKDFTDYTSYINSKIDADGRMMRIPVAKLMDKEYDNDYDVYVEVNPDKVAIVNDTFGPISNSNINGTCYSAQIGNYQTDFIDLLNPAMGAAYYSASSGLVLHYLLKNAPYKLRATDLCSTLNGDTFIISTDPQQVYMFLGLDVNHLLRIHNRQELFTIIQKSWIYDPIEILEFIEKKSKDKEFERPVMADFIEFCRTHPKDQGLALEKKTLQDALEFFGKTEDYAALVQKQSQENIKKIARAKTKDLLMQEFKKKGVSGKELGAKMNEFKEWIYEAYKIDYDTWALSEHLDIDVVFNRFYI
jgi:hypothetical protein